MAKNKGGMNDNGPSWGKVYTTYAGISKAANWTDSALSALYSYYGKTVRGLFHTIDVRKSTGISSVSGGRYILLWYICDNQCKQFCRI